MTKPLLERSNQSMLAAEALVKQQYYASSVSRAYFSCLQYILHILIEKLGHSYDDLGKTPRTGTHSQAQYLLESTLYKKNRDDYRWFQQKLPEFKKDRVIADYHPEVLGSDHGHEAITTAKSIITTLKKYY